ncbi:MAG: hypothetical protein ACJ72N_06770 [Labedaea sp.]
MTHVIVDDTLVPIDRIAQTGPTSFSASQPHRNARCSGWPREAELLADQQRRSDDEKKKLLGAEDVERPANHPDTAHGRQRAFRLGIDTAGTGRA